MSHYQPERPADAQSLAQTDSAPIPFKVAEGEAELFDPTHPPTHLYEPPAKKGLIRRLYDYCMYWAGHRFAVQFLAIYSFFEAIILPIPIDAFLAPIAMANPKKWWRLATYATIASLLGGCVGYSIGYFAHDWAYAWISAVFGEDKYQAVVSALKEFGTLLVFLVGFTPLPFKVFSIVFGMFQYSFWPFIYLSLISRQIRFLVVAGLFAFFGEKYREKFESYLNKAGWIILIAALICFAAYKLLTR